MMEFQAGPNCERDHRQIADAESAALEDGT